MEKRGNRGKEGKIEKKKKKIFFKKRFKLKIGKKGQKSGRFFHFAPPADRARYATAFTFTLSLWILVSL